MRACNKRLERLGSASRPRPLNRSVRQSVAVILGVILCLAVSDNAAVPAAAAQDPRVAYPGRDLGYGATPCFSPDGSQIAFSGDGCHLCVMDSAGLGRRVISALQWSFDPRWSPDGSRLAFASYGPTMSVAGFAIWVIGGDGDDEHRLIDSGEGYGQYPFWSKDGRHIVWTHGQQLWIAETNGGGARPLTKTPAKAYECCGDWSRTNEVVIYVGAETHHASSPQYYRIWRMDPNVAQPSLLCGGIQAYSVKVTADGSAVYYGTDVGLFRMPLQDCSASILIFTWPNGVNSAFDVSPNERWLVYESSGPVGDNHLRRVSLVSQ